MTTSRQAADLGVVVHGPEVVDSGSALRLISLLLRFGSVRAVLGGTMGRVAVIDAGLEEMIDIGRRLIPSCSVLDLQAGSDLVVLLNQAKSMETGLAFGAYVAARAMTHGPLKPLLQIDCGGMFVAELVPGARSLAEKISRCLGMELISSPVLETGISAEGDLFRRRLTGVLPEESISVNGTVVGRAFSSNVEILARGGRIIDIRGAEPKAHGIEKLPPLDLKNAIIRSGDIRRTDALPGLSIMDLNAPDLHDRDGRDVVLIDHSAEGAFEDAMGASIAITVGDDTTAIAGDILARMGVVVIGITDGDPDRLSHRTIMPEKSIVLRVRPEHDDILGGRIRAAIFRGGSRIRWEGSIESLADRAGDLADQDLVSVDRY